MLKYEIRQIIQCDPYECTQRVHSHLISDQPINSFRLWFLLWISTNSEKTDDWDEWKHMGSIKKYGDSSRDCDSDTYQNLSQELRSYITMINKIIKSHWIIEVGRVFPNFLYSHVLKILKITKKRQNGFFTRNLPNSELHEQ